MPPGLADQPSACMHLLPPPPRPPLHPPHTRPTPASLHPHRLLQRVLCERGVSQLEQVTHLAPCLGCGRLVGLAVKGRGVRGGGGGRNVTSATGCHACVCAPLHHPPPPPLGTLPPLTATSSFPSAYTNTRVVSGDSTKARRAALRGQGQAVKRRARVGGAGLRRHCPSLQLPHPPHLYSDSSSRLTASALHLRLACRRESSHGRQAAAGSPPAAGAPSGSLAIAAGRGARARRPRVRARGSCRPHGARGARPRHRNWPGGVVVVPLASSGWHTAHPACLCMPAHSLGVAERCWGSATRCHVRYLAARAHRPPASPRSDHAGPSPDRRRVQAPDLYGWEGGAEAHWLIAHPRCLRPPPPVAAAALAPCAPAAPAFVAARSSSSSASSSGGVAPRALPPRRRDRAPLAVQAAKKGFTSGGGAGGKKVSCRRLRAGVCVGGGGACLPRRSVGAHSPRDALAYHPPTPPTPGPSSQVGDALFCSDVNSTAYQFPLIDATLIEAKGAPAVQVGLLPAAGGVGSRGGGRGSTAPPPAPGVPASSPPRPPSPPPPHTHTHPPRCLWMAPPTTWPPARC